MPWSSRYSSRASSGVSVRARTSAAPSGPPPGRQHDLLVGEPASVAERRAQPALALDLDDQGRQPGQRGHARQGRGDRRLADAALPGDDEHSGLGAEPDRIHSMRRLLIPFSLLGLSPRRAAAPALAQPAPAPATST